MSTPEVSPGLIQVSAWSQHAWLRAGFSTRIGGESTAYGNGDLNLGFTQSDEPANVARNRSRFLTTVGVDVESRLITLRQFHSNLIHHIQSSASLSKRMKAADLPRGDGLISDVAGITLGVQTADCVPVLVADVRQRVVGAFHAGWRGTLERIVQRGAGDFISRYGSRREDLVAAIGPCIGVCCFAVDVEVCSAFESQFCYGSELFHVTQNSSPLRGECPLPVQQAHPTERADGHVKHHLNLVEANRKQLLDAGLVESALSVIGECTACARTRDGGRLYFSHRAEQGFTGRMLSVIGIDSA